MIKTRFIFTVSFMALMVVSSALASVPSTDESVATTHTVYSNQTPIKDTGSIAGVTYVNKAVNVAGASAQAAEAHAAAAGASALAAADSASKAAVSAKSANDALEDKVDKATLDSYATKQYVDGQITSLSQGNATEINALKQSVGDLQDTAVTYSGNAVGSATRPVWVDGGVATAVSGISVPFKQNGTIKSWAEIWIE